VLIGPPKPIFRVILLPGPAATKSVARRARRPEDEHEYEPELWLYTVPAGMAERGREERRRPMFVADGRTVAMGEIALVVAYRGDLLPVWTRLLRLIECETRAGAAEDEADRTPDDAELQALSEQFRYDRDLITAEETERWLEERGLTLDDFSAYCLRHYWADRSDVADDSAIRHGRVRCRV